MALHALVLMLLGVLWLLGGIGPAVLGRVVVGGEPVYARAGDGWSCHLLDRCSRDGRDAGSDAVVTQLRAGETVVVQCVFGSHVKIRLLDDGIGVTRGWVGVAAVSTPGQRVRHCSALQW